MMHILGLCNGSIHGNSEVLLKAALNAARQSDPTITVTWIHVPSVAIPSHCGPFSSDPSIIPDRNDETSKVSKNAGLDDRKAVFNAIMDADALVIFSPVYSHQPAGSLKALTDAILGPYADVSEAYRIRARQEKGDEAVRDVKVDPRELKAHVAGFIAVAGSGRPFPEQWTMALPTMHTCIYALHAKVVDQVVFPGFANAGAVLLDAVNTIGRAETLGRRIASQIGKPYEEAKYLGEEEEGSCPYCHMLKVEFRKGNHVVCIVCGANGVLEAGSNGNIKPKWEERSSVSCLTLEGKWKHLDDIHEKLGSERPKLPSVAADFEKWKALEFPVVDLPSLHENSQGKFSVR